MATLKTPDAIASLAAATSANGTARTGAAINLNGIRPGCLILECVTTIVTGSVVATYKVQGSMDQTNWFDVHESNNSAYVTVTANDSRALACPLSAWGYSYLRVVATLSGAATAAGDTTAVTVRFLVYGQSP